MMIKKIIKNNIDNLLREKFNLSEVNFSVEYPPQTEMGDYSCNAAMILVKELKKNPMELAREIASEIKDKRFQKVEAIKPGFINFHLSADYLQKEIIEVLKAGDEFGKSEEGKGKNIVIDYSAPNIAKKMHIGHLRSTVIGASIYNLYKFLGYNVIRDNHLGDWGTQFGKLIYQYKTIYGEKIKEDITVEEMEKMYLDFHAEAKKKPEIEEAARAELKKLQDKDGFNFKLWQLFYEVSIAEFKKVYEIFKVDFDEWRGESVYNDELAGIVADAMNKKIAMRSEGAVIIDLQKYNLPAIMIQKSDGAFLYSTTDLATIKYRHKKYHPVKNLYVVANQQALYFEQLFKASELLGYHNKEEMTHIKFGLILGKDGKKMSTREGGVVGLLDIIAEGINKAKVRIKEKNKNLNEKELDEIAKIVAIGAIKYSDLSQNRLTDIIFDWDKMLSWESGSSPYLQYTYVRINSILNKINIDESGADYELLREGAELKLMKDLVKFTEVIESASIEYKPNLVALYLEELAKDFHSFYENISIIKSKPDLQPARVGLIKAVAQTMKNGLALLGIEVPEKM